MARLTRQDYRKSVVIIAIGSVCIAVGAFVDFPRLLSLGGGINFPSIFSFGGGIKNACLTYKEEMTAHNNSNPMVTGNYDGITDPVLQEWAQNGDAINKRLFDAVGIAYSTADNRSMEQVRANAAGIMEAAQKCYNVGVDFGGMKELLEYSKGIK